MIYLEQPPVSPAEEIARDETAYLRAESTCEESVRAWTPGAVVVVMGRGNKEGLEIRTEACQSDGIQILRRSSGGGAVLLMPGCFCYSLILNLERRPELSSAHETNTLMLRKLARAFGEEFGASLTVEGDSDLAFSGRKIAGHAQRRGRSVVLFHGCLLLDADTSRIGRYLHFPSRRPVYRRNRAHEDFVMNTGWEMTRAVKALKRAFLSRRSLDFNMGNSHISRLFCD